MDVLLAAVEAFVAAEALAAAEAVGGVGVRVVPSFCAEAASVLMNVPEKHKTTYNTKARQLDLVCATLVEMKETNVAQFTKTKELDYDSVFNFDHVKVLEREKWYKMWTELERKLQTKSVPSKNPMTAVYEIWLACGMLAVRATRNQNTTLAREKKSLLSDEYKFHPEELEKKARRLWDGRNGSKVTTTPGVM